MVFRYFKNQKNHGFNHLVLTNGFFDANPVLKTLVYPSDGGTVE